MTEAAFRSVYEEYRAPLFRFGYRLTGSVEAAEDLVHDCFVGLFRAGFDERRGSLKTYLYGALRNLACKHFRHTSRDEMVNESHGLMTGGPLEVLLSEETARAVQCAVASLPLAQREVLVLFEYEELPLDEIAKIVEADCGAVKSRLHRARENLRKSLSQEFRGQKSRGVTK